MAHTVAVVDYGVGNLHSVLQALRSAAKQTQHKVEVQLVNQPEALKYADRIVLPGQGAMPSCMAHLQQSGLYQALQEAATQKPLLGVCVGMQMLLDHSAEGNIDCLGWVKGQVERFQLQGQHQADGSLYKVPHMGWNRVAQIPQSNQTHPLWEGIPNHSYFYFVHSFYVRVDQAENQAGQTIYGQAFCSALAKDNLFATQFHPEKSAAQGLRLYQNFLHWQP